MIQLKADCLLFEISTGETVPCSVENLTIECLGDAASWIEPELIRNAAAAVLHYFRIEQGLVQVPLGDFTLALEKVLRGFGFEVRSDDPAPLRGSSESDLQQLACRSGKGCELFFFPLLKEELQRTLQQTPAVVRFNGLRPCVKQLIGARRWSARCQQLSDQIVEFLRSCIAAGAPSQGCCLVVS